MLYDLHDLREMRMEYKTIVDQIEILRDESIGVRIAILIVDGETVVHHKWHRTSIPLRVGNVDISALAQMEFVNTNLSAMQPPFPPVAAEDIQRVEQVHALLRSWNLEPKA